MDRTNQNIPSSSTGGIAGCSAQTGMTLIPAVRLVGADICLAQSIDSEWPGKVRYSFSLPNTMVPFGSAIDPSVHLEPLTEGLQIESIRIEVVEEHVFASSRFCDGRFVNRTVCPRVVADKTFCSTKDQGILQFDDTENTCDLSLAVPLPTSIHDCAQDVQSPSFDLTHKVVFTIRLINLDGYKSLVRKVLTGVYIISNTYLTDSSFSTYCDLHACDEPKPSDLFISLCQTHRPSCLWEARERPTGH